MKALFLFGFLSYFLIGLGQEQNTLDKQFNNLYKKSSSWESYKMIPRQKFLGLQNTVNDSLTSLKKHIIEKNLVINEQKKIQENLSLEVQSLKTKLENIQNTKDSRSFLGWNVSPKTFKGILITSYALLLFGIGFFAFKFQSNAASTRSATRELANLREEFDEHQKTSLKRFQEVNRKLQDELLRKWKEEEKNKL